MSNPTNEAENYLATYNFINKNDPTACTISTANIYTYLNFRQLKL